MSYIEVLGFVFLGFAGGWIGAACVLNDKIADQRSETKYWRNIAILKQGKGQISENE